MEDDGYWKDVEMEYLACLKEGMTLPKDELWSFAKERAQYSYFLDRVVDKAKREGRDYHTVLREEKELRLQERESRKQYALN